jgi:cellulose biosynthesis protein BcsQ
VSSTNPPAPNQHHTPTSQERPRATAMSVISRQPPDPPRSSNGATTMLSSPASARRGPLLAVCGLCGGAGASTLAYLTALAAVRRGDGAVLLADTGGPTAGISHYAGAETPRSLSEVSELLAASLPVGQLLATTSDGLRVLASEPRLAADCARDGIELLLDHARRRYTLTVIDCGTLAREADQIALASATHVAWVLPATAGAVDRGRQLLGAIAPHPSGREMLLVRQERSAQRRTLRELRGLARERRAPLILLPTLPELATGNTGAALETAQVSLQAILGALAR